jgi:hypothetical protein
MYIVMEMQTNADGAVGTLVWSYNNINEAWSKYHSVLSTAAVSSLPCHACVLLGNDGNKYAAQVYRHGEE